jgi:predicted acylesterase/phospholipase RssA
MRRILSIDGGGIKGVFPAAFLATVEQSVGGNIADYFDLIVGTSTGGIIALGLGMGLTASEILSFYEVHGPGIFGGNRFLRGLRSWFRAKYDRRPLELALVEVFGDRKLGESRKRLVIPSLNSETGEVHVWKTSHHPRLERDYRCRAVEVGLSTAAAPTFFPTYVTDSGTPLLDGGMWANNPIAVATVEALGILGWQSDEIQILSLGCTSPPLDVEWGRKHSLGKFGWANQISEVFLVAQSFSANGMALHLVKDRQQVLRISPSIAAKKFDLDSAHRIPALKGLGDFEARKALPELRKRFFESPVVEDFIPFHRL